MIVSCAFIVLSCFPDATLRFKALAFFIIERFMIVLKLVAGSFLGTKRWETEVVEKRRKYLEDTLLLSKTHSFHHTHGAKPKFVGPVEMLSQGSTLWESVEHEDEEDHETEN